MNFQYYHDLLSMCVYTITTEAIFYFFQEN